MTTQNIGICNYKTRSQDNDMQVLAVSMCKLTDINVYWRINKMSQLPGQLLHHNSTVTKNPCYNIARFTMVQYVSNMLIILKRLWLKLVWLQDSKHSGCYCVYYNSYMFSLLFTMLEYLAIDCITDTVTFVLYRLSDMRVDSLLRPDRVSPLSVQDCRSSSNQRS